MPPLPPRQNENDEHSGVNNTSIDLTLTESELQIIHAFRSLTNPVIECSHMLSPFAAYISHQMAMTTSQITRTTWFIARYWWLRHSRRRYGPVVASLAIGGGGYATQTEESWRSSWGSWWGSSPDVLDDGIGNRERIETVFTLSEKTNDPRSASRIHRVDDTLRRRVCAAQSVGSTVF